MRLAAALLAALLLAGLAPSSGVEAQRRGTTPRAGILFDRGFDRGLDRGFRDLRSRAFRAGDAFGVPPGILFHRDFRSGRLLRHAGDRRDFDRALRLPPSTGHWSLLDRAKRPAAHGRQFSGRRSSRRRAFVPVIIAAPWYADAYFRSAPAYYADGDERTTGEMDAGTIEEWPEAPTGCAYVLLRAEGETWGAPVPLPTLGADDPVELAAVISRELRAGRGVRLETGSGVSLAIPGGPGGPEVRVLACGEEEGGRTGGEGR